MMNDNVFNDDVQENEKAVSNCNTKRMEVMAAALNPFNRVKDGFKYFAYGRQGLNGVNNPSWGFAPPPFQHNNPSATGPGEVYPPQSWNTQPYQQHYPMPHCFDSVYFAMHDAARHKVADLYSDKILRSVVSSLAHLTDIALRQVEIASALQDAKIKSLEVNEHKELGLTSEEVKTLETMIDKVHSAISTAKREFETHEAERLKRLMNNEEKDGIPPMYSLAYNF
jgi:hypothetical protein